MSLLPSVNREKVAPFAMEAGTSLRWLCHVQKASRSWRQPATGSLSEMLIVRASHIRWPSSRRSRTPLCAQISLTIEVAFGHAFFRSFSEICSLKLLVPAEGSCLAMISTRSNGSLRVRNDPNWGSVAASSKRAKHAERHNADDGRASRAVVGYLRVPEMPTS